MPKRELGPEEYLGDNGDLMTQHEARAIGQLQRLARQWPKTLKLISMGGSLHVIHAADERYATEGPNRGDAVLATIHGIPNDGGDW